MYPALQVAAGEGAVVALHEVPEFLVDAFGVVEVAFGEDAGATTAVPRY